MSPMVPLRTTSGGPPPLALTDAKPVQQQIKELETTYDATLKQLDTLGMIHPPSQSNPHIFSYSVVRISHSPGFAVV